jgi:hypothetical protein
MGIFFVHVKYGIRIRWPPDCPREADCRHFRERILCTAGAPDRPAGESHGPQAERKADELRHRLSRGSVSADRQPRAAREQVGQPCHAQADRGHSPRAQLHRRQACLLAAQPARRHHRAIVLRGPDPRRQHDQPVLPGDARFDHAPMRQPRARLADLVPADGGQLARRLSGQSQGRRAAAAWVRRLHRLPGAAGAPARAGHAFRSLA